MQNYEQAATYITTLTQQPIESAVVDFRCIHDVDRGVAAHNFHGTLPALWSTLVDYQSRGYGVFVNMSALDGVGRDIANVHYIRAHVADLDGVNAEADYSLAAQWQPLPTFAVVSSPNKFHIYWVVNPYTGNDYFTLLQRRIVQQFNGDRSIIDPTRVMRLPGTLHLKRPEAPHLVSMWSLGGVVGPVETLASSLAHVNVIDSGGGRKPLGDPSLTAPSLDWLRFGLSLVNPCDLDRGGWLAVSAAFKQAGFNHASEDELYSIWSDWCANYPANDVEENRKLWLSVKDSETGWKSFYRFAPTLNAYERFGFDKTPAPMPQPLPAPGEPQPNDAPPADSLPDILSEHDQKIWFKDCYAIESKGKIFTPSARYMDATKFNIAYGGKLFIVTPDGKTTNEPWQAATRSIIGTIPKVDHIRFLPDQPTFAIVEDQLGRKGLNTYIPIKLKRRKGDIMPWLQHIENMLPVEYDRNNFHAYLAHNVKYPGFKIPWAPLIQSAEGVGKGFIQKALSRLLGEMYTYSPPAEELVKSGATFNQWQSGKLMIIVNEIKIDERRELIEIMKPWITDDRIQIQGKGDNQEMEDNPANWLFFSNHKDAIPINKNGRRYAIFYSVIQSTADLLSRGMNDAYFAALNTWLQTGGYEILADWLLDYPIDRGAIPMRAPETSSQQEAVKVSRGPIEVAIVNAVEDGLAGFRGGYVSTLATMKRLREVGVRQPAQATVHRILEGMGYFEIGRAPRAYGQESMFEKSTIFAILKELPISEFGKVQGYE